MIMENYYKLYNERHSEHSSEQKDDSDCNMLVLDLSRKKRVASTLYEAEIIQSIVSSQTLLPNTKKQKYQEINFLDENTQTPARSSAMLSPYSESNSPKETKISSVDYENNNQLIHTLPHTHTQHALSNTYGITPRTTMVTPPQPSLLTYPNEATNMPVAVPKIYLPYIETSQSCVINNDARRIISMPAECSTSDAKPSTSSDVTKKTPRPFKAYPNNLLSVISNDIDHNSNENYVKFRKTVLETFEKGNKQTSNPKMRRVSKSVSNPGVPTSTVDEKDAIYWERRKKNNEAAKRSRDARRAKEDELAIRTSYLEYENARLKMEIRTLKLEIQKFLHSF
ncbi:PREDICTED: uncharacterized protein LOC108772504 [Cyphomyrmex costatus]|uniref:Protein giant n=1 Tax=Cyphomyrmex costatus TaxID=456900 RepID=A0A195CWF8_9HYME|nr:PREDICTED: uncharacterized protein LOC108772504 [Cyphomyrmex costatus]KYN04489.1 Protein giant [Cyphomyrmex costatus]